LIDFFIYVIISQKLLRKMNPLKVIGTRNKRHY